MNDEYRLLDYLNSLYPITPIFRAKLASHMAVVYFEPMDVLLYFQKKAEKAWWLIEGYIVALGFNGKGEEVVIKIFYPGLIATNLSSFMTDEPSVFRLVAIGSVKTQELQKEAFIKLKIYRETNELLAKVALIYKNRESQRLQILLLPIPERVREFVRNYPVAGLPDQYIASWLRITREEYQEQIALLPEEGIVMGKASVGDALSPVAINLARKIELYIKANYVDHELTTLSVIALAFSVSEDTVVRHFKKEFGKTVAAYTREYRMDRAKAMLAEGRKVYDIAEALGYQNEYNFRRDFKNFFQLTPSQMTKAIRPDGLK